MNTISKTSPDLLKERLEQLKNLFPDLFTNEGKLNEEELKALVSQYTIPQTERYEFRWAGKAHSKKLAFTTSKATLVPDEKRSIDFDKTENLIIEGENLEVLKLFQKSYFNKVKCIYIDPPYNTGNDFIYNDDYSENKKAYWEKGNVIRDGVKMDTNSESVGRYHSNWLDMMQSRLLLARNLLKEDGVIFVSIDDHEVANLRKLMDEIFGEENLVATFIWRRRIGSSLASSWVSTDHEYVLLYSKDPSKIYVRGDERDMTKYNIPDGNGKNYASMPLTVGMNKSMRPNQWYKLINPKTGTGYWPPEGRVWAYYPPTMQDKIKQYKIIWPEDFPQRNLTTPRLKSYPEDAKRDRKPLSTWIAEKNNHNESNTNNDTQNMMSAKNEEGTRVVKEIMGETSFIYPKPLSLIKSLIDQFTVDGDIIIDFFAGSGTTAQAIEEVNNQYKENRHFILIQLPEKIDESNQLYKSGFKTISDICIERVKRAGEKIKKEDNSIDTGFKVFKLTYSHFPENLFTPDPEKSEEENIAAFNKYLEKVNQQVIFDFEDNNLLYEIALKDGFNLNFKIETLSEFDKNKVVKIKDDVKEALVCLDQAIADTTVELLQLYKEKRFICLKRAVDTTKKWNLQQLFEKNLWVA
jgi:adenine-specific DNA-methyltransferase